jgi:hypothetical protein
VKINVLWGNKIALVLVSCIFSILLITLSIMTVLSGQVFDNGLAIFTIVITFYNCATMIAYYMAYRLEVKESKYSFMSPKKYKQSVKMSGLYESIMNKLKDSLSHTGESLNKLDDDAIIDRVIEIIEGHDTKVSKD